MPQHLDWGLMIAAALVGAAVCAPLAMFAFAPPALVVFVGLIGAAIGVFAAVLACEQTSEQPA
ncbi:MAG TPA: hypothetical protein VM925_27495 [Labilithrix sp.]|jgi:hypothetical protein|nr:hypothetical protein [Labilithrix sp.]